MNLKIETKHKIILWKNRMILKSNEVKILLIQICNEIKNLYQFLKKKINKVLIKNNLLKESLITQELELVEIKSNKYSKDLNIKNNFSTGKILINLNRTTDQHNSFIEPNCVIYKNIFNDEGSTKKPDADKSSEVDEPNSNQLTTSMNLDNYEMNTSKHIFNNVLNDIKNKNNSEFTDYIML